MKNIKIVICVFVVIILFSLGLQKPDSVRFGEEVINVNTQSMGKGSDLFNFEYDRLVIFEPYQTKDSMEDLLGFESYTLRESVSEGMMNFAFVKGDSIVYYVFGYPDNLGYNVNFDVSGSFDKEVVDDWYLLRDGNYIELRGVNDEK